MTKVSRKCSNRVPKNFFCPISKQFMNDPVIAASTKRTYDRKSLVSLREGVIKPTDNMNNLPPENEPLLPDYNLRRTIAKWRREYTLAPPFFFISTPKHLEAAINALLQRDQHQLEDQKLLQLVRELNVASQGKLKIFNSKEGFLLLGRLIAGCPLESTFVMSQWVQLSVSILAHARDFNQELDFGGYQHKMLAVLDRVSADIHDAAFQKGLLNLIHSCMGSCKEQIVNSSGIVRALCSNLLPPGHRRFDGRRHFAKLLNVILGLWSTEGALKQPQLSQAVASLVWPMPTKMSGAQFYHVLHTISSRLKRRPEGQTLPSSVPMPLEAMTRAGLVKRIFLVLEYATLPQTVKLEIEEGWLSRGEITSQGAEEVVFMRCFEILECLSMSSIGRLEIVRVISRSGYRYLLNFYNALARNTFPHHKESHIVPAISMIFNVLEYCRYTPLVNKVSGPNFDRFAHLVNDEHPMVSTIANQIFNSYERIRSEERDPPPQQY